MLHILGNTGPHCIGENREGKALVQGHTVQQGKRDWNGGYPTLIPALSAAPCFFFLKHFRCSRQLLIIRDHILIFGSHSPSICWVWALLLTPTAPKRQLVCALQMRTHLNVSWSNTQLERQTGDKNRCDNHSILDCQQALPGPLNYSWGK